MDDPEAAFVEQLGQHLYGRGMQRMAGRVWAWLLICEPAEQTAEQLALELHASRGAISGAVRALTAAGVVQRSRRRGDRREFFSAPPGAIRRMVANAGAVMGQGREIADEGLALLAARPAADRARLLEFRDLYAYYEREWPLLVGSYVADRKPAAGPIAPEKAMSIIQAADAPERNQQA